MYGLDSAAYHQGYLIGWEYGRRDSGFYEGTLTGAKLEGFGDGFRSAEKAKQEWAALWKK